MKSFALRLAFVMWLKATRNLKFENNRNLAFVCETAAILPILSRVFRVKRQYWFRSYAKTVAGDLLNKYRWAEFKYLLSLVLLADVLTNTYS